MLEQCRQAGRKHRRARVAALELAKFGFEIVLQRIDRDAGMPAQQHQIGLRLLEQRQKQMLDIDLVMTTRQAQAGRALCGAAGGVIELGDQCFELTHDGGDDSVRMMF